MKKTITIFAMLIVGARQAIAHSGHGVTEGSSLSHYLLEAAHFLPAVLLGATVFAVIRRRRSRIER